MLTMSHIPINSIQLNSTHNLLKTLISSATFEFLLVPLHLSASMFLTLALMFVTGNAKEWWGSGSSSSTTNTDGIFYRPLIFCCFFCLVAFTPHPIKKKQKKTIIALWIVLGKCNADDYAVLSDMVSAHWRCAEMVSRNYEWCHQVFCCDCFEFCRLLFVFLLYLLHFFHKQIAKQRKNMSQK